MRGELLPTVNWYDLLPQVESFNFQSPPSALVCNDFYNYPLILTQIKELLIMANVNKVFKNCY